MVLGAHAMAAHVQVAEGEAHLAKLVTTLLVLAQHVLQVQLQIELGVLVERVIAQIRLLFHIVQRARGFVF